MYNQPQIYPNFGNYMSRQGVTFEQVELAAEKILATGENPTIEKVRRLLGGTGSNSTLSKHLHGWRSERLMASSGVLPAPNLPPDPINAAVDRVWKEMARESEVKIHAMRAHYETETSHIKQQLSSIQDAHDHLVSERDVMQQELYQVTAQKELLLLDVKAEQQQSKIIQERHDALQRQYQILKQESIERLAELHLANQQALEQWQTQIQLLQNQSAKQLDDIKDHYETIRQNTLMEIDSLKTEKKLQEKNNSQLSSELHALKIELVELRVASNLLLQEKEQRIKNLTDGHDETARAVQEKLVQINSNVLTQLHAWQTADMDEFKQIKTHLLATDKIIAKLTQNVGSLSVQTAISQKITEASSAHE